MIVEDRPIKKRSRDHASSVGAVAGGCRLGLHLTGAPPQAKSGNRAQAQRAFPAWHCGPSLHPNTPQGPNGGTGTHYAPTTTTAPSSSRPESCLEIGNFHSSPPKSSPGSNILTSRPQPFPVANRRGSIHFPSPTRPCRPVWRLVCLRASPTAPPPPLWVPHISIWPSFSAPRLNLVAGRSSLQHPIDLLPVSLHSCALPPSSLLHPPRLQPRTLPQLPGQHANHPRRHRNHPKLT